MREIKFRAIHNQEDLMLHQIEYFTLEDILRGRPVFLHPEHWNFNQFTGLLDKNGKEIWEGDIVELDSFEPKRYEVVFNRGGYCLKFGENSHYYPDIKYAEDSIVIGNIYETPNLINLEINKWNN